MHWLEGRPSFIKEEPATSGVIQMCGQIMSSRCVQTSERWRPGVWIVDVTLSGPQTWAPGLSELVETSGIV